MYTNKQTLPKVEAISKKDFFSLSKHSNQNPSADFLRNIRYKEGIMKICNHYSIIQKEFLLPAAGILLWQYFSTHFQKNLVRIGIILLQPQILLGTTCPDAATFSTSGPGTKTCILRAGPTTGMRKHPMSGWRWSAPGWCWTCPCAA